MTTGKGGSASQARKAWDEVYGGMAADEALCAVRSQWKPALLSVSSGTKVRKKKGGEDRT